VGFKPRYAIAFGIVLLAAALVFVLLRQGASDEIWSTVAAAGFTTALIVAFGGKCSMSHKCRGSGKESSGWLPWMF
jgi:hypothetical protein